MGIPQKGNPESIEALAGEIETGFDDVTKIESRLYRYSSAKERALINLTQIEKKINNHDGYTVDNAYINHLYQLSPKIRQCGDYLRFREYYTVGKIRLAGAYFCKAHLLCPFCAIRRGSKLVEEYTKKHAEIMAMYPGIKTSMLTVTIKNGEDLAERMEHLTKSLQRLFGRRRDKNRGRGQTQAGKIIAAVGTYEVTNKGNGWHPHAHITVMYYGRILVEKLKAEWFDITGDSHVLRLDPAKHPKDPAQDFLEIFKYAVKFGDLSPELNLHAYEILRRRRLVFSIGDFRKVKINDDDLLDTPLDELPFFERLYKFVSGSGYSLEKITPSEDIPNLDTAKIDKKRVNQRDMDDWCGHMVAQSQKIRESIDSGPWNGRARESKPKQPISTTSDFSPLGLALIDVKANFNKSKFPMV